MQNVIWKRKIDISMQWLICVCCLEMGPPKKFQLNKMFEKSFDANSNSSNSSTSSGKRANRTRFTDYQIKVLQEFFENNSYPKDSDLEYLSKLLLLSPRVIVVWFQVCSLLVDSLIFALKITHKLTQYVSICNRTRVKSSEKFMKINQTIRTMNRKRKSPISTIHAKNVI